jgi:hypothetical protein
MRWLLFVFLLGPLHSMAEKLIVVVYTTDAKQVEYRCRPSACVDGASNRNVDPGIVMQTVNRTGRVEWHAIGGVPPYKVVRNHTAEDGMVTVTIMDAVGNFGTGLGVIGKQTQVVSVDCRTSFETTSTTVTYKRGESLTQRNCEVPSTKTSRTVSTEPRKLNTTMRKITTGAPTPTPVVPKHTATRSKSAIR